MSRLVPFIAALALLAFPAPVRAQQHHHHHHHFGHSYGYVPWYSGGAIVSPSTTVVSPAISPNTLPYRGPGVTIALDAATGGSVNYVIDGQESATIQAGQQQTLTAKGGYEIRFSRGRSAGGRDLGEARYTVTEGSYHFTATEKGWELFRDKEQPNLVTTQAQPASPSGLQTRSLAPTSAQPPGPSEARAR